MIIDRPSPNFDERASRKPVDFVVLHYTGMQSAEGALARLTDPAAKVSAHYVIGEEGRVYRLVAEEKRAWHAGVAYWRGVRDVNTRSLGIELVNPGHEFGYRAFPDPQIEALVALLDDIATRHPFSPAGVIGHSDVAPQRKEDPGELFPWARLAAAGYGLWPNDDFQISPHAPELRPGMRGAAVLELKIALDRIGYGVEGSDVYDGMTEAVVRAFQRHFRSQLIDGISDPETTSLVHHLARRPDLGRSPV